MRLKDFLKVLECDLPITIVVEDDFFDATCLAKLMAVVENKVGKIVFSTAEIRVEVLPNFDSWD